MIVCEYKENKYTQYEIDATVEYEGETYTLTKIGENAFDAGLGVNDILQTISLPNSVVEIGNSAFENLVNLQSITIPTNLEIIGNNAFAGCTNLNSMNLSETKLSSIGMNAFDGCSNLSEILLPNTLVSVGEYAFQDCRSLKNITIPENVNIISKGLFQDCSGLTTVYLDKNIQAIQQDVFWGCGSLTDLYIKAVEPPTVEYAAFDNQHIIVYVPKGLESEYEAKWQEDPFLKNAQYVGYYDTEGSGETAGIESVDNSELEVVVNGNNILVRNIVGNLQIYSVAGVKAAETSDASFSVTLPDGIYILKTPDTVRKVILR